MLFLSLFDVPAIRYGPREADMEEVVEGRISHLAKTHSHFTQFIQTRSENYYKHLHLATQCYFSRYYSNNIPKRLLLAEVPCCKACHRRVAEQPGLPTGPEMGWGGRCSERDLLH